MSELFNIDDIAEEIEQRTGCPIEELYEGDYLEILYEAGIEADSAWYNLQLDAIEYEIHDDEESEEPARAWTEEYLNTLGMSKSDF